MSRELPGKGPLPPLHRVVRDESDDTRIVASRASQVPENPHQRLLLLDLSRMTEPAVAVYLRNQIIDLHEALTSQKDGNVSSSVSVIATKELFERYGLNVALAAVLLENNPEGRISISPSKDGNMQVLGENQTVVILKPKLDNPFLSLELRHKNKSGARLSSFLGYQEALKVIDSPVLNRADAYLKGIWRTKTSEGITEEYRNTQALVWSVARAAYDTKLIAKPLHPTKSKDILTVPNFNIS